MSETYTEFPAFNYDHNQINHQGYGVANSGPTDDRKIVAFFPKSILNVARSKAEGKRVCENKDYITIVFPGETLSKLEREANDDDKRRWPRQWAAYSSGKEQTPDGIPMSVLFPAHPNICDMLRGYNIHTVEQLAHLSGSAISTVGMGCQEWVNRAIKYLEQAEKGVDFHRFNKSIEEKDQQISTLQRQVGELNKQLQQVMNMVQKVNAVQGFDVQSSMIANLKAQEEFAPPPQNFAQTIVQPDLSGQVKTRKPRADRGVPRGPRKET
jgi:hypothetical protein